jgi:L-alanine-DL-glutamate epimerase-like enolase superfamily enzyme
VCTAAHLHLSAAMSNFLILEEGARNPKIYRELFGSWEDSPASWTVPEKPGLGVTLSEAVIRDYGIPFDKSH